RRIERRKRESTNDQKDSHDRATLTRVIGGKCPPMSVFSGTSWEVRRSKTKCRNIRTDQHIATNLYKIPAWNIEIASISTMSANAHPRITANVRNVLFGRGVALRVSIRQPI